MTPAEKQGGGEACPWHSLANKRMGYVAHAEWMSRQRGKQGQCPVCRRWLFASERGRQPMKGRP